MDLMLELSCEVYYMVLNVKKSNFFVYAGCLVFGLLLIVASIIMYLQCPNSLFDEIMLSIGCSTIPTVITAYLIDQASEKRDIKRIAELRSDFMWGMPHGLLWIMKIIIERYYPFESSNNKSMYNCFEDSIRLMASVKYGDEELQRHKNEVEAVLKDIDYGISLCIDGCRSIISHDYELEINKIFTKDELLAISYLLEECQIIKKTFILSEMAEYIKLFVKNTIEKIPEIYEKTERTVVLKNRIVRNWYDISK